MKGIFLWILWFYICDIGRLITMDDRWIIPVHYYVHSNGLPRVWPSHVWSIYRVYAIFSHGIIGSVINSQLLLAKHTHTQTYAQCVVCEKARTFTHLMANRQSLEQYPGVTGDNSRGSTCRTFIEKWNVARDAGAIPPHCINLWSPDKWIDMFQYGQVNGRRIISGCRQVWMAKSLSVLSTSILATGICKNAFVLYSYAQECRMFM